MKGRSVCETSSTGAHAIADGVTTATRARSFVQPTHGPWAPARFSGNCNSSAPPPPPRCRSHPCCCAAWTRTLDSLWLFPGCQTSIHPVRASHCGNILVWNHSRVCTIYLIAAWKWGSCYFGFLSLSTRLHISKLLQCENCVLKKKTKLKKEIVAWFCKSFR